MPKRRNPFADIPPITDFESCQRARPLLLHALGDALEVWRGCDKPACKRAKSCRRSDGACLTACMQALPDEDRRLFRYALENRSAGLDGDEAFDRAEARVEDEMGRSGG